MSLTISASGEKTRLRALLEHFAKIEDPREPWRVAHPLPEVLLLVVCGTIADCDDYDHMYPLEQMRRSVRHWGSGATIKTFAPSLAGDPEAMMRHTEECRYRRIPFAADPSQQLARMHGDEIRLLVEGAAYLFTNEYEAALTEQKTGWSSDEILERVGTRVTTLGPNGVRIERQGEDMIQVPTPKETHKADPTGVGDAFRAGFLAGLSWGLPLQRCAQVGSLLATHVIESVGTQEYELARRSFLLRIREAYGDQAADEIGAHISLARP